MMSVTKAMISRSGFVLRNASSVSGFVAFRLKGRDHAAVGGRLQGGSGFPTALP